MLFLLSLTLAILITVPGMYLLTRARLVSSAAEMLSTGFFLGYSLLPLVYLGLSQILPIAVIDLLYVGISIGSLYLLIGEARKQHLPAWSPPLDRIQAYLVAIVLVLLFLIVLRELSVTIDDDYFIHLPNIKRISMGDIPPHMPYFPETLLRGHIARDLLTGSIGRFLQLTPEISLIYVSLAACPFYILIFQTLASRLSGGNRIASFFTFVGLLFFISGAIGEYTIRAGCITYVFNNTLLACPHFAFIVWLFERCASEFTQSIDGKLVPFIRSNKLRLTICVLAYAGL